MSTILITGGTGLIGKALSQLLLQRNHQLIILTRKIPKQQQPAGISYAIWNVAKQTIDVAAVQAADYIIHLAGANVADKRWTDKRKKEIIASRTESSALLIKTLKENANHVKAVVSASAIGWYGADAVIPSPHPFTETDPAATDFLGETCKLWEESITPVSILGKRLVILRTGIVLSTRGGALKEFLRPLRFGIAGILGSGKQIISWIHLDDICRLYLQAVEDEKMEGVYNAVTSQYLSNKTFTLQLAKAVKHTYFIPVHVPAGVLKLALGEMSVEVLKSATISGEKIKRAGFTFVYPSTEAAFNELVKNK